MSRKMYLALRMCRSAMTNLGSNIDLSWNDGQIGAMPVFKTKKAAREAYGKKVGLQEIAIDNRNEA